MYCITISFMPINNCDYNMLEAPKQKKNLVYIRSFYQKSNYVIYLLECLLCKIQYIRNSETAFHIRLNNHIKDKKILMLSKHANI